MNLGLNCLYDFYYLVKKKKEREKNKKELNYKN